MSSLPALKDAALEVEGRVAVLTLKRDDVRNALTGTHLVDDIVATLEWANGAMEISALVLTGAGAAFSAGGNIKTMRERSANSTTEELERYADRLIDRVNAVAPNFKGSIMHRQVIGPHQMESEWGLIGGNIFHGELTVDQLFHMRPAPGYADYRTPIDGLYQASSATHAGGGVTGMPGHHCVREIVADKRVKRRRR